MWLEPDSAFFSAQCSVGGVMACRLVFAGRKFVVWSPFMCDSMRFVLFRPAWAACAIANWSGEYRHKHGSPVVSKRERETNEKNKNGQINFEIIYCSHKWDIFSPAIRCSRIDDSTDTEHQMWRHTVLFIEMSASMHSKSRKSKRTRAWYTSGVSSSQAGPGRAGPGHIDDATWNIHRHQQIHVTRIAPLRVFNVRFQTIALRADEFNSVFSPVVVVVVSSLLMRKCYSALCALMPCCRWCSACVQFHVHYSHFRWQHVKLHIIILLFSSLSPFLLSFHRLAAFSVLFSFRRRTHSNEHNGFLCSIMSRCVRVFYYRIFRVNRCSTKSASTEWYWESVLRQRRRRRRKKQIDAVNNTSTELYGKCGAHQTQC